MLAIIFDIQTLIAVETFYSLIDKRRKNDTYFNFA